MTTRDKVAGAFFVLAVVIALGAIAYVTKLSRDERQAKQADSLTGEAAVVRGVVLDYARAVQRGNADDACILLTDEAFQAFDCRFGRQDVPRRLALPEDAEFDAGDIVVQGDEALVQLRGGPVPQPVRLRRVGQRWSITRVGNPRQP